MFRFSDVLIASITDRRPKPRISTVTVVKASMALFWARLGSLNALEMSGASGFWKRWLGQPMPTLQSRLGKNIGPRDPAAKTPDKDLP